MSTGEEIRASVDMLVDGYGLTVTQATNIIERVAKARKTLEQFDFGVGQGAQATEEMLEALKSSTDSLVFSDRFTDENGRPKVIVTP